MKEEYYCSICGTEITEVENGFFCDDCLNEIDSEEENEY